MHSTPPSEFDQEQSGLLASERFNAGTTLAALHRVREHIEALRLVLLDPTLRDLDRRFPELIESIGSLVQIERELKDEETASGCDGVHLAAKSSLSLRSELDRLKVELRVVIRLVDHGAAFWHKWASFLGAAEVGYIATGEAAALNPKGSVSCRG